MLANLHNKVISVILLAFCGLFGYYTLNLPKTTMSGEPGPGFFPTVVLVAIAILSVAMFFSKERKAEEGGASEEAAEQKRAGQNSVKEAMLFYALFIVGVILIGVIGFIPGFLISLVAMLKLAGWELFPNAVVFSGIVIVSVFLLFDTILRIPLPKGILF